MILNLVAGAQQLFENLNSDKKVGRAYGDDPVSMWQPTGLDCEQYSGA
ncbi:MAG: hypothetical protein HQ515_00430 [Phycisphaeraceae bacterium]|nr:hypothetical protein [Phycisphaeraceae bacterium]